MEGVIHTPLPSDDGLEDELYDDDSSGADGNNNDDSLWPVSPRLSDNVFNSLDPVRSLLKYRLVKAECFFYRRCVKCVIERSAPSRLCTACPATMCAYSLSACAVICSLHTLGSGRCDALLHRRAEVLARRTAPAQ